MFTFHGHAGHIELASIEPAGVAGLFYPGDRQALLDDVRAHLHGKAAGDVCPEVVIAPHAGYQYSGGVAGSAYAALAGARDRIERVVVIGPAHRVAVRGLATSGADLFRTPAGDVPVDREMRDRLLREGRVARVDAAFAREHCIEVQLPFLTETLGAFKLVPLLVGDAAPAQMAGLLDAVWGGDETVIVISSDLSHYLGYDAAVRKDRATARAILSLGGPLGHDDACGRHAINGLVEIAKRRGMRVSELDHCNSGDTAGPRERVVGYGAYAFFSAATDALDLRARRHLLGAAAAAIRHGVETSEAAALPPVEDLPAPLARHGASFVTLKLDGRLRGCIGTLEARRPLGHDVAANAFSAAFRDPRFPPLGAAEFERVEISVSVLGTPTPMTFTDEADLVARIEPGRDGLILTDGTHRGTFLPSVWESIPSPVEFLRQLKVKAGLAPDHWSERVRVWRYRTQNFS